MRRSYSGLAEAPLRQQMELLAGLSVTTKAVERTAEAIGADIERRQQRELAQALQHPSPHTRRRHFAFPTAVSTVFERSST